LPNAYADYIHPCINYKFYFIVTFGHLENANTDITIHKPSGKGINRNNESAGCLPAFLNAIQVGTINSTVENNVNTINGSNESCGACVSIN
jgi:hypothetical protein